MEFVPVTEQSKELAPGEPEREYLRGEILRLRQEHPEMVYISFPGDEKSSGGCVAAGRGFFHINSHGGAEPCPFSPYSDVNVRNTSLREALHSPLFTALRSGDLLMDDHAGGCVLYEKRHQVEALLAGGGFRKITEYIRLIPVLLIMTSNAPDTAYLSLLRGYQQTLNRFVGPTRLLVSGNTLQLKDYGKTDWPWTMFDPEAKQQRHDTVFPEECKNAFALGAELV